MELLNRKLEICKKELVRYYKYMGTFTMNYIIIVVVLIIVGMTYLCQQHLKLFIMILILDLLNKSRKWDF